MISCNGNDVYQKKKAKRRKCVSTAIVQVDYCRAFVHVPMHNRDGKKRDIIYLSKYLH